MKNKLLVFLCAISSFAISSLASPITIVDTTSTGAVVDGSVGGSEYVGNSSGINSGFGDVWGGSSELHIDSDLLGNLYLGFVKGPGAFNDTSVIYFDTRVGGFGDTIGLSDTADLPRAAVSGDGFIDAFFSDLTFAPDFDADFALVWQNAGLTLYELVDGANLTYISNPTLVTNTGAETSFLLSDIGVGQGDSFDYVSTYLNAGNAFRSDEFHGVAGTTVSGNVGNSDGGGGTLSLASGDFNTFTAAVPEPATLGLILSGFGLLALIRKLRA